MSFDWMKQFLQEMDKPADYVEKTLAAYSLGMKASREDLKKTRGALAGVRVIVHPENCPICSAIKPYNVYHPDEAPRFPLERCENDGRCRAIYRPVMTYQLNEDGTADVS